MRRDLRKGWREGLKGGNEAVNARNGVGALFLFVSRPSPHEKRPVAVTRQAIFPDLDPFLQKKYPVIPDLGVLLGRNAAEFRI